MEIQSFFTRTSDNAEERSKKNDEFNIKQSMRPSHDYLNFGYDYFDNREGSMGYRGYYYDGRHADSVHKIVEHYGLSPGDCVLDVGCAKGYVLEEFRRLGLRVQGIDISTYAINNALENVKEYLTVGTASSLPYDSASFDFVYAKESLPHLEESNIPNALQEIMRVSKNKQHIYLELQCGYNQAEKDRIYAFCPAHKTVRSPKWWEENFTMVNYQGDYCFKRLFKL